MMDATVDDDLRLEAKCKVLLAYPPSLRCKNCHGWTVHHLSETLFPGDDPRTAHSLKIIAPVLFPQAKTIVSGDIKCPHTKFYQKATSYADYPNKDGFFLKHPMQYTNQSGEVEMEFERTIKRLKISKGQLRFEEILKQKRRYRALGQFQRFVDVPGRLPDSMCIGFRSPASMLRFSCVWNCEVVEYSMREELSFDFARKVANKVDEILFVDSPT